MIRQATLGFDDQLDENSGVVGQFLGDLQPFVMRFHEGTFISFK